MATDIEICNSALIKVGAGRIVSLDEDSASARLCKEQYPKVLLDLLRAHPWSFAIKRVQLAETTQPEYGYVSAFQLPNDCLRVLEMEGHETIEWRKEGRTIVTDASTVKIKYISSNIPPGNFDNNFAEALAAKIAADICYSLVQSVTLREQLMNEAQMKLAQARSFDSQEGSPRVPYAKDWLYSRF
jgi:hypothetical protein